MSQLDTETARLLERIQDLAVQISRDVADDLVLGRQLTDRLMADYAGTVPEDVLVTSLEIETNAGALPLRLYRPSTPCSSTGQPLVIFFHGGGWAVGSVASYEPFIKSLCAKSGVLFLSVDFRLAPEHKFPTPLDDCRAAVRWAQREAMTIGVDPRGICVMGDSAGANLAVVTAWCIAKQTGYRLCAQYLLYPFLDLRAPHGRYPSRERFGNGQFLISRDDLDHSAQWYLEDTQKRDAPEVSPILLPDLSLLPPTILVTAGFDPLADEGRLLGRKLARADVPLVARHFDNTIHGFLPFGILTVAQEGQEWLARNIREKSVGAACRS